MVRSYGHTDVLSSRSSPLSSLDQVVKNMILIQLKHVSMAVVTDRTDVTYLVDVNTEAIVYVILC